MARNPLPAKKTRKQVRETERRNPRSLGLDQRTTFEIVRTINEEDAGVAGAVKRELPAIARAVDAIVRKLGEGGRLIYVGAGTSGRLATLDAAECPPTFGVAPSMVQAVMAGGRRALTGAVEGAEDSAADGKRDLGAKRVSRQDAVVGITASGSTPYVLGALQFARKRGAATIAITANRRSAVARAAQISIAPETGPEVIAGSTRMKAGTAQKMVLNILSTAAMVRMGHVYNNWMVDVALTNEKLRERGLRILQEATGSTASGAKALRATASSATVSRASSALTEAGGNLRVALVMLKTGASASDARRRLRLADGNLRRALGE